MLVDQSVLWALIGSFAFGVAFGYVLCAFAMVGKYKDYQVLERTIERKLEEMEQLEDLVPFNLQDESNKER